MRDNGNIKSQRLVFISSIVVIIIGIIFAMNRDWDSIFKMSSFSKRNATDPFILIFLFAFVTLFYSYKNIRKHKRK